MVSGMGGKRRGSRKAVARAAWPWGMGGTPMVRHSAEPLESRLFLATVYVDSNPAITTRNGQSWATAYAALQSVLTAAVSGTTIKVADGTHKPTSGTDRNVSFILKNGVGLYGGYAGFGAIDPNMRDVEAYPTILSGDIGVAGSNTDNSYHVVVGSNTDATAVLDGFTITAGNASPSSGWDYGGGMYVSSGSPTFNNCTVISNASNWGGGGMYNYSSSPTLTNCAFSGNSATIGGGMYNDDSSSPTLTNCTFSGNTAAGLFNSGGGMKNDYASSPTLTNCILWGNTAAAGAQISDAKDVTSTIAYSDIQGAFIGVGNIDVDPLFVRNPSAGPDGKWGTADDDCGDLRLQAYSPAADAGVNTAVPAGVLTDLASSNRFVDIPTTIDTGSGTAPIVDMGAYEAVPALAVGAGGPYFVPQGQSILLRGHGASTVGATLLYAWEWNGDGKFDEATGPNALFSSAGLAPGTVTNVILRITDSATNSVQSTTTLTVVPSVYYVDATATGANNGTSWGNAYTTLGAALGAAVTGVSGQQIRVARGTYRPTSTTDRSLSFQLKSGVSLLGGYAGYGAADPDARSISLYPSILSGDIGVIGSKADNSYHVVVGSGTDFTGVLDGFTITAGNANGDIQTSNARGGGLFCLGGSPTVANCSFSSNSAPYGGGIYNGASSPTLANCTFSGNSAEGGEYGSHGGGMYNSSSSPTLTNCTFNANSAASYGGGIFNAESSPMLTGCSFIRNAATNKGFGGGVFNAVYSSPTLTNCIFLGNVVTGRPAYDGGSYYGGGMFNDVYTSPTLTNCIFVGNSATYGGGIASSWSSQTLINCTFTGNYAFGSSSVIYNSDSSSAMLANCIIWGNSDPYNTPINHYSGGTTTITYSDVQYGGFPGVGNLDADPLFARNPSPGADGKWGTADDDYGDLRVSTWSPVVDAGDNSAVSPGIATDLAGNPRFLDVPFTPDTGSGSPPIVDMGAYELAPYAAAKAGGPYLVAQGHSVALNGLGAGSVAGPLQFDWEWTGDGKYDDRTGSDPVFDATGWPSGQVTVSLRVTDAASQSAIATADLTILPAVFYVDANAAGANNGLSWANAFTSLASALSAVAAGMGQEIHVADGTYKPTTGTSRTTAFQLRNGVRVSGGYAGVGAADPDARNPGLYPSILSGDIRTVGNSADNSYHVINGSGTNSSAILDGFTIMAGNANGSGSYNSGGGIYVSGGSPTITNCVFIANSASNGGGMYNTASSPMLTNCVFAGNSATTGRSMYNASSSAPILVNCTLAEDSSAAIYNSSSSPAIRNSVIWSPSGTAITQSGGTSTVTFSLIKGGFSDTGNINTDPLFVRNPSPGTDGIWGTTDDDYGDLRLQITSPCADAGSNAAVPAGVTTDLAGNPRIVDIPGLRDPGAIVDMGAYERVLPTTATITGLDGKDAFALRLTADQSTLQVWAGPAVGTPMAQYSTSYFESFVFDTGTGIDSLTIDLTNGLPLALIRFLAGDGNDALVLTGTGAATGLNVQTGQVTAGGCTINCTGVESTVLDALAGAVVQVGSLTVGAAVGLAAGKGLMLRASGLAMVGAGALDLADGQMILDYTGATPAQAVRGWVFNGQVGTTPAIKSSGHLAMIDNALIHMPSLGGQALAGPFSQVLIMQTLAGDANLDGVVDERDLLPTLTNMGRADGQWVLGDLDQDGNVDVDDFALVQANVGAGGMGGGLSAELRVETAKARLEYKPALLKSSGTGQQDGAMNRTVQGKKAAKAKPRAKVKVKAKVGKHTA
jgi:hypothetical protein